MTYRMNKDLYYTLSSSGMSREQIVDHVNEVFLKNPVINQVSLTAEDANGAITINTEPIKLVTDLIIQN